MSKVTAPEIADRKRRDGAVPIVMITAYDTPFTRIVDEAGVDVILVGDSVADNVLGFERTIDIDVAAMRHHVAAVARAKPKRPDCRRSAVDELPRRRRGHAAQRRAS